MGSGCEVAICGMSGRFPGSSSVAEFWQQLVAGAQLLKPVSVSDPVTQGEAKGHWVETNCLLPDVDQFDASFFGFSPREAAITDPQHRLFLEGCWEALEDAGYATSDRRQPVSVFAGANFTSYFSTTEPMHFLEAFPWLIGSDKDYLATRVAHRLNLSGPAVTVQSACSTSLVAVHLACQALVAGECDAALAGAVSINYPRMPRHLYMPGGMLSPDGYCRAFDANGKGTVFAEGMGVVLLMRLEDALANGYPIYSVIIGSATNNDGGTKSSYTAPSIEGQVEVIRSALAVANVSAADISYVEAHGTGTVLGDAVELTALRNVFTAATTKKAFCHLGSVKTNIGHLASAAGMASIIKTSMALKHGLIPATLNFQNPNPDIDLASSPFRIPTSPTEWTTTPRRAGVSSFGVGGTNAHVILEEPPPPSQRHARPRKWYVLTLSGRTEHAAREQQEQLKRTLSEPNDLDLADVAFTLQRGRREFDHRRAVVCQSRSDAVQAMSGSAGDRVLARKCSNKEPVVAFMFPGQGAQHSEMAFGLYQSEVRFQETIDDCVEFLRARCGLDLDQALRRTESQPIDDDLILQTRFAQPALFVTEYALAKLLEDWGIKASFAIGHSIGEYVAACFGGVLSLEDALTAVAARGAMMQEMRPGRMLSVSESFETVQPLMGSEIDCAAINGPSHCVVAGEANSIGELERRLAQRGIATRQLHTSHAFHSRLFEPMLSPFSELMGRFEVRAPSVPYVSNVTGELVGPDQLSDPRYWAQQIRSPVQFASGLSAVIQAGTTLLLEVGPGRQLSSLARINGVERQGVGVLSTMTDAQSKGDSCLELERALARLWVAGVDVEWERTHASGAARRVHLPTYPFQRKTHALDNRQKIALRRAKDEKLPIDQWFYTPSWHRAVTPTSPRLSQENESVLIFSNDDVQVDLLKRRVGPAAVQVKAGAGFDRIADDRYVIDPQSAGDYAELLASADAEHRLTRVVHCWSMDDNQASAATAQELRDSQRLGLYSLLKLASALRSRDPVRPIEIDIITRGVCDVFGDEAIRPQNAPLLAFQKVIPQENPAIICRIIDEDGTSYSSLGWNAFDELTFKPRAPLVAIRKGHRWVQTFEQLPADKQESPPLRSGGTYLIVGGLGNIGLVLSQHLSDRYGARLILTSRSRIEIASEGTAEGVAERRRRFEQLKTSGANAELLSLDVADYEAVLAFKKTIIEKYKHIDGIVFAAGSVDLSSGSWSDDTAEFERHLAGKAAGLLNFERAFGDVAVDFCVVLSSLSTILGGLGHGAYSAANHIADCVVGRHNRTSGHVWTISDWDLWSFGHAESDGVAGIATARNSAITAEEGTIAFEKLLMLDERRHVVISARALQPRIDAWIRHSDENGEEEGGESKPASTRPELDTPFVAPQGELEEQIAKIWQDALGIDRVGRNDDFLEVGGHSLLGVQILGKILRRFGVELQIDKAFSAPTVAGMAGLVDDLLQEKIADMPIEEVQRLLAARQPATAPVD